MFMSQGSARELRVEAKDVDLERIVEQQLLGGQPVPELLMRPLD